MPPSPLPRALCLAGEQVPRSTREKNRKGARVAKAEEIVRP
jgi:hypothetical protein